MQDNLSVAVAISFIGASMMHSLAFRAVRLARKKLSLLAYSGRARYCPVCERKSGRFASFGVIPRPDARCVHCSSLERHRFLWLYLCEFSDFFSGATKKVLHFAPEPFFEKKLASTPGLDYITTDIEPGCAMTAADITGLPFPDRCFDIVLCSHVLEHIPDDVSAIRELYRVMKPGGCGLLMVPLKRGQTVEDPAVIDPQERVRLFGQADHVRMYGDDFPSRLEAGGFAVEIVWPVDIQSREELSRLGIPPDSERIFRVSRP